MINVLITHADEPLGRKVVKALFHDEEIGNILAVGDGPPPRGFDRYLSDSGRVQYTRVDLAKHRPASELFRGSAFRSAEIDSVIHIPRHGAASSRSAFDASSTSCPPMMLSATSNSRSSVPASFELTESN